MSIATKDFKPKIRGSEKGSSDHEYDGAKRSVRQEQPVFEEGFDSAKKLHQFDGFSDSKQFFNVSKDGGAYISEIDAPSGFKGTSKGHGGMVDPTFTTVEGSRPNVGPEESIEEAREGAERGNSAKKERQHKD